jgi:predicted YcjX-like family ATPase
LRLIDEIGLVARTLAERAVRPGRRRLRLGVTGLARSGKTLFITALVDALTRGTRLPGFAPMAEGRMIGASLIEQPHAAVPRFAVETHRNALIGPDPHWPQSTRGLSELSLLIRYRSKSFGTPQRELEIDIVDYPGEWLLDLGLLTLDFASWSDRLRAIATADPNPPGFLSADPQAVLSVEATEALARDFTAWLKTKKADPTALLALTPGRFLLPGELEGSPALTFAPLPAPGHIAPRDSVHALFAARYEAYKRLVVRPFFRDHFARLDRQIVLADPLSALNGGAAALSALSTALTDTLTAFRAGDSNPITRLVARRIDRILFAASKADHIHSTSHDRLEALLNTLVADATRRARFSGAATRSLALASVRATREAVVDTAEGPHDVIVGVPEQGERMGAVLYDGKTEIALFPGDLPETTETLSAAPAGRLHFLNFRPPLRLERRADGTPALPYIRLDRALDWLIGDWMK